MQPELRLSPKTTTIHVPVVFHNLRDNESHLLMQAISKVGGRVTCIQNNTEKYISFSLDQRRFIDSDQFLLASLDKLVAANKPEAFKITGRTSPGVKGESFCCAKACTHTRTWTPGSTLPSPNKEAFFSKLSDQHITEDDYAHAQRVERLSGVATWGTTATSTTAQTCSS